MCDRQFRKHLARNLIVSATLVSKPTVSAGSFARLDAKPIVGVNVPCGDLRRRNVLTAIGCCPPNPAPSNLNEEATAIDIELERQQINVRDVQPPKIRVRPREATLAQH